MRSGIIRCVKRIAAAGLLVLAACTADRQPQTAAPRPNVLLITIDTLRADRVGHGLTPAIDGVAAHGIRFTSARAAAPLTLPSHTSILTGLLPPQSGVRLNGVPLVGKPTLGRLFHDAGYRTAAFVGAYVLDRRFGLSGGFDTYDDRIPRDPAAGARLEAERRGDLVAAAALEWLGRSSTTAMMTQSRLKMPLTTMAAVRLLEKTWLGLAPSRIKPTISRKKCNKTDGQIERVRTSSVANRMPDPKVRTSCPTT